MSTGREWIGNHIPWARATTSGYEAIGSAKAEAPRGTSFHFILQNPTPRVGYDNDWIDPSESIPLVRRLLAISPKYELTNNEIFSDQRDYFLEERNKELAVESAIASISVESDTNVGKSTHHFRPHALPSSDRAIASWRESVRTRGR